MRPDIAIEDDARRIVVDQRPLAMLALGMARVGKALGGEIVRKADVVTRPLPSLLAALAGEARARRRHILVDHPPEGAVIDDDILRSHGREGVGFQPAALRRIGRAYCRKRHCQYCWISVGSVYLKKKR